MSEVVSGGSIPRGLFGDPAKHPSNNLFRLWQYVESRGLDRPDTLECAEHLGVSVEKVRMMLRRLSRYIDQDFPNSWRSRGKPGAGHSTWSVKQWTVDMCHDPFPTPRGWKPGS